MCPTPVRNAGRRAQYAATKMAARVAVEGGAPAPSGQLTEEEMSDRFAHQLRAQADAWADRDPAYAKRLREAADAQAMLAALQDQSEYKGVPEMWGATEMSRYKYHRDLRDLDGNPLTIDATEWEGRDHTADAATSDDGETWTTTGTGTLHHPETGQWIAYRYRTVTKGTKNETSIEARVADDLNAAAEHLTTEERAALGLPEPRPAALEVVEVPKVTQAEMMKDLRRQLVGDNAEPDAALEFAVTMQAQMLESVARGATGSRSFRNRVLIQMQANRRGANIAGWTNGVRQWEAEGRVLKPGAQPYEILAPVIKGSKVEEDDATGDTTAGGDTSESAKGRRFTKQTADGKTLVGFHTVKVYDWTQTVRADGQPDLDWKATVPGGSQELLERLKASSPHPIEYDHGGNSLGHAHGWTDGRKIVLDPHKSVGNQISTLAHEMTHAELDHVGRIARGEMTREEAEQEAQLGAYLVVRALDLGEDTDEAMTKTTSAYLRNWTREDGKPVAGHKQRWQMLQDRITPASEASHRILTRLFGVGVQESPAQAGLAKAA